MDPLSQPLDVRTIPPQTSTRESLDPAALTRRMVKGDEAAYRVFYDAYFGRLSRYLLVVTRGDEDAMREALQGTFHRVVRHIRVFDDETIFWSWLTVLARSAHADERRKKRRYLAFLDRFERHSKTDASTRNDTVGTARLGESLERSIQLLPVDERELLDWKYGEHKSVRQIAEQLATSEKAVESQLARIRRKLKAAVLSALRHEL